MVWLSLRQLSKTCKLQTSTSCLKDTHTKVTANCKRQKSDDFKMKQISTNWHVMQNKYHLNIKTTTSIRLGMVNFYMVHSLFKE